MINNLSEMQKKNDLNISGNIAYAMEKIAVIGQLVGTLKFRDYEYATDRNTAAEETAYYWIDDEIEKLNFTAITEEVSFYLNEKDDVVIVFDEGEVAPMHMGAVEFEIPAGVLRDIRK